MHRASAESRFVNNRARELVIKAYTHMLIRTFWPVGYGFFSLRTGNMGMIRGVPGGKN